MKFKLKVEQDAVFLAEQERAFTKIQSDAVFMAHLSELGLTSELILKNKAPLIAYYESYESVKVCQQANECVNEHSYHYLTLTLQGAYVNLKYELCPVYAQNELRYSRFVFRDIEQSYLEAKPHAITERKAQLPYLLALRDFNDDKLHTIYVHGPFGVGKLTLAMTAVNRFLRRDEESTVGVLDFRLFTSEYSNDYYNNKNIAQAALDKALAVDLLVVREFGNEDTNKLIRDVFSFPLVTERIKSGKKTIIISEFPLDDLHRLYDPTMRDVRVKQIIEMLRANAREVSVTGVKI